MPQQINNSIEKNISVQKKALALDNERQNVLRQKQKRELMDKAYELIENRQKNIDMMMKQVHVVNNKPTWVSPLMAQPNGNPYGPQPALAVNGPNYPTGMHHAPAGQYQRSTSLPHLGH